MLHARTYLALDLGASGGRAILGRFDGERLTLEEIHRFGNGPVCLPGPHGPSLHWDAPRLFSEVLEGLRHAVSISTGRGSTLESLGLDTWGVDYGLLDRNDRLVGLPYHYRDARTDTMLVEAFRRVPREEIFAATGIQFMSLNTLYQVLAQQVEDPEVLARTRTLLMMPDLLNFWLTGRKVSERTIASTSQMLDTQQPVWATPLLDRFGIPTHVLPPVIEPGTILGPVLPAVADETGARGLTVVAPGCHDTASAIAAVPADGTDYAYLSSGTWSLMGVESDHPVISSRALACGITNERGVCQTIRLLKNITGLWIIQECRRAWMKVGHNWSWDDIIAAAAGAPAFGAFIDVDAPDFAAPGDMPARIDAYCARTGQPVPASPGEMARLVFESLAMKYRRTLETLDELVGRRIAVLHIVGGGTQNRLLSQFAANAIGRPVVAGPVEATAAGNILMQMVATGAIGSLAEGRAVIRQSFETEYFRPRDTESWDDAYDRFTRLVTR